MAEKKKKSSKPKNSEALKNMREKSVKPKKEKKPKLVVMKGKFDVLPPLGDDEKKKLAEKDDLEFRQIDKNIRIQGVRGMVILREMKGYELHKFLKADNGKPYTSFDHWLKEAAPISRSGAYAQLKVAEKLFPLIPKKELEEMSDISRKLLAKVPKMKLEKVDSPIRHAARTQDHKGLAETIKKHAPEAHVESRRRLMIDDGAAPVIFDALDACKVLNDTYDDGEALEICLADYLDSPTQDERFAGMSNRVAAENLRKQQASEKVAG